MANDLYIPQTDKVFSLRQELELERGQLEIERSSFVGHWRELGENIRPRRTRFVSSDRNRGDRRNQKIIDSTATRSSRTLRSGMTSGVTSPARPWFTLTTANPDLAEVSSVKDWLYTASQRMATTFLKSNLYNVLPIIYGDLGDFATAAMYLEEDQDEVVRFYPFPIGSYCLAQDAKLRVNLFYREFDLTVRQIVEKFGTDKNKPYEIDWTNISPLVKRMWEAKQFQTWITVRHFIRPNPDHDPHKLESRYKKYQSIYYEAGSNETGSQNIDYGDLLLSVKGYDYFPVLAPRWEVTAEDVYGTSCPGMDCLGDIKQLQLGERRGMEAIEKMVRPPMVAPTSMRNQKTSILPGDISYSDERDNQKGFRPAFEVNPRILELNEKQNEVRQRIKDMYFEDLFLMLSESDRRQITATEIDERKEEKLLALGPVLEQLNQDLLDPLIDITFSLMLERGDLTPPPKELHGQPIKIEYLSVMAQAQKLIGIEGIERFANFAGNVIAKDPSAAVKVDTQKMIETYGDMLSVTPGIIRTDEEAQAITDKQQQAQAAQQKMAMMQQGAQTAQTLSQTDTSGNNALNQLLQTAKAGQLEPTQ